MADPIFPIAGLPTAETLRFNTNQAVVPVVPPPSVTETKKADVSTAAQLKQINLGGYADKLRAATAVNENNMLAQTGLLGDLADLTPAEVAFEHGSSGVKAQIELNKYRDYVEQGQAADRGFGTTTGDSLLDVGAGLTTAVGSLASLGAGLINDRAGVAIADANTAVREGILNQKSEKAQVKSDLYAVRRQLDKEDRQATAEREAIEATSRGELNLGALKTIGRGILDGAEDLYENPEIAGAVASEGIGSLLAGGVIAKGLGLGARGMTALIAAQEGGGAYGETVQQILDIGEAAMTEHSVEYRTMREQGASHEEAAREIATDRGMVAAAVQGIIGAVTGKAVAKFEANPLAGNSLGGVAGNIGRETIEEGIQEGTTSLTTGTAVASVDPTVDPFANVGEGIVAGVVGGAGSAGIVQSPAAIGATGKLAVQGTAAAGNAAWGAVTSRLEAQAAKLDDASGVGKAAVKGAFAALGTGLESLSTKLRASAPAATEGETAPATPETDLADQLDSLRGIPAAEVNAWPAHLRNMVLGENEALPDDTPGPRLAILQEVTKEILSQENQDKFSEQDKARSALWLHEEARRLEQLGNLDGLSQISDEEVRAEIDGIRNQVSTILSNPEIKALRERAATITADELGPMPEITPDTAQSPEVQSAIRQQVTLAEVNPEQVDLEFLERLLNQKVSGELPAQDQAVLQAAYELKKTQVELKAQIDDIASEAATDLRTKSKGVGKTQEQVREDVLRNIARADEKGDEKQRSLAGYVGAVAAGVRSGSTRTAQAEMDRLRNFATSMANKLKAAEQSTKISDIRNNKVSFATWTGERWVPKDDSYAGRIGIFLGSDASVALGRAVHVEALAAANTYNSLLKIYGGQVTGKPLSKLKTIPAFSTRNMQQAPKPVLSQQEQDVKLAEAELKAVAAARKKNPTPLMAAVKARGGIQKDSYAAKELAAMGVTPETRPGLFVASGGLSRLDNLVSTELEATIPGISGIVGTEGADYLSENGLLEALAQEATGRVRLDTQEEVELAARQANAEATLRNDAEPATPEPATPESVTPSAPTPAAKTVTPPKRVILQGKPGAPVPTAEDTTTTLDEDDLETAEPVAEAASKNEPVEISDLVVLDGQETSLFGQTYELNTERSSLIGETSPLRSMYGLLVALNGGLKIDKLRYATDSTKLEGVRAMLSGVQTVVLEKLNKRLAEPLKNEGSAKAGTLTKITPLEFLESKGAITSKWVGSRALSLVNIKTQGYDQKLIEAALVATAHWLLNMSPTPERKAEQVSKDLGIPMEQLRAEDVRRFNQGVSNELALRGLSQTIMQFWGATAKADAPTSDVQGIVQELAAEILLALEGTALSRDKWFGASNQEFTAWSIASDKLKAYQKQAGPARGLLAEVNLAEWENAKPSFGVVPQAPKQGDRIKRTPMPVGPKMRKALAAHRKIAFKKNSGVVALVQKLGKENYMKLRGWIKADRTTMNKEHFASVDGYNQSLSYNWDRLEEYLADLDAYVTANPDQTAEEVAIHFDHEMMNNSRIHAKGSNYQSNKLIRETLVATKGVLDISDEGGQGAQDFWVTVAQAFGVKTENNTNQVAASLARDMAAGKFGEALGALEALLTEEGGAKEATAFTEALAQAMGKEPASDKLIHALHAVVRYYQAREEGGTAASEFAHALSLEADGKTDGPFHAIGLMDHKLLTVEGRKRAARGGLFVNSLGRTIAKHLQEARDGVLGVDGRDLYQTVADEASNLVPGTDAAERDPEENTAVLRLISKIYNMVQDADGRVKLNRPFTKNPTTIVIYGSGDLGIAGKVAYEIRTQLAELMTELAQIRKEPGMSNAGLEMTSMGLAYPELVRDLELLTSSPKGVAAALDLRDPLRFELNNEQKEFLTEAINKQLIKPLTKAIDKELGGVVDTSRRLQAMTQVQGEVMMELFRRAVADRVAALVEAGKLRKGELLSQKEYSNIYKELSRFGIVVTDMENMNGEHVLSVGDKENVSTENRISRSFDGQLGAPGQVRSPQKVGVSFGPQFVISRGDAEMMINYFSNPEAELGVAPVFDGLEMRPDRIREISEAINKAVYDAWMDNPVRDAELAWKNWLRQGESNVSGSHPIHSLTSWQSLNSIAQSMGRFFEGSQLNFWVDVLGWNSQKKPNYAEMKARIEAMTQAELDAAVAKQLPKVHLNLVQQLSSVSRWVTRLADEMEAVKAVLDTVPVSVDHMSSGEKPFQNGKAELIQGSDLEVELELERRKVEELKRIRAKRGEKNQPYEAPKPEPKLEAVVQRVGTPVRGYAGITKLSGQAVQNMAHQKGIWEQESSRLIKALARFLPEGATYYFGTNEALAKLRSDLEGEDRGALLKDTHGQYDPTTGRVWITTSSQETILHETIHAVLDTVLRAYYEQDGEGLVPAQKEAIQNLEKLMGDFLNLGFTYDDRTLASLTEEIRGLVQENLDKGTEIGRINALTEFAAYALSAQPLVQKLKETRVNSPLKRIIGEVLKGIRKLFRLPAGQSMDMFSQTYLNVAIALMPSRTIVKNATEAVGDVLSSGPEASERSVSQRAKRSVPGKNYDKRMQDLLTTLHGRVGRYLSGTPSEEIKREVTKALNDVAQGALNIYGAAGFAMTSAQQSAFRQIHAGLTSGIKLNNRSLVRLQTLYGHVARTLTAEDLIPLTGHSISVGMYRAEDMMNSLLGGRGVVVDAEKKSTLMISFLALAQVHPEFREVLRKMSVPAKLKVSTSGDQDFDTLLGNFATNVMSSLEVVASKQGRNSSNVTDALDNLADALAEEEQQEAIWIETQANDLLTQGDKLARGAMDKAGNVVAQLSDSSLLNSRNDRLDGMRSGMKTAFRVFGEALKTEKSIDTYGEALLQLTNKVSLPLWLKPLTEMITEIVGMTDAKAALYRLVNESRYQVAKMRQAHREDIPDFLGQQFSRKVTKEEWTSMYAVLGQTDAAVLLKHYDPAQILEWLKDPNELDTAIENMQDELKALYGQSRGRMMVRKSNELARFLARGEIGKSNNRLLRNAYAIAHLMGENGMQRPGKFAQAREAEEMIDQLVSMKALQLATDADRNATIKVLEDEKEGSRFVLSYLLKLREDEQAKLAVETTFTAKLNQWKGHIPAESMDRVDLQVKESSEHAKMSNLGYTKLGDYNGSGAELGKRSYYYSTTAGKAPYLQGALQMVQRSINGIDPRNGLSVRNRTAGVLKGRALDAALDRLNATAGGAYKANEEAGEPLLPVWDENGKLTAMERHVAVAPLEQFQNHKRLDHMMGAWAGRQAEEALAKTFNEAVLKIAQEQWEKAKGTSQESDFVDISESTDPAWVEAYNLLPASVRKAARDMFDGPMMVRKDMVENTVGYRLPSIADAWQTGGRWSPEVQKNFRQVAEFFMGTSGFTWTVNAEKTVQGVVSFAKTNIVVRSVVVPLANLASSYNQLLVLGVSPSAAAKGMITKLVETNRHLTNVRRLNEIEVEMARYADNEAALNKLEAERRAIKDAEARMSIHDLLEAGEFAAISEGLTETDQLMLQGRYVDKMRELAEKIPEKLGTLGRYAVITENTALFRGMSRAVQYGDFIAKGVYYDHMRKQGIEKTKALNEVREEFVGYNFLPGRTRSYAESVGLTWFWAYKIRSVKIALRQMRRNPVRVLLMNAGLGVAPDVPLMSVGTPQEDNFVTQLLSGELPRSMGWDMLFRSWSMNPWANIAG